jgi:hypothetical protein
MPTTHATTRLHQIVAVQHGVEEETKTKLAEVRRLFTIGGDQDPLTGLSRTYEPKGDGDEKPDEMRKVQVTAAELVGVATKALARLLDLKLVREEGNCKARADVITKDGITILEDVPVGYLLFLETRLGELIKIIETIPTLNPAVQWDNTVPGLREGVWASAVAKREVKDRIPQVQILSKAQVIDGQAFQPQVRPYETEAVIGWWHNVRYSGQMDPKVVQAVRERAMTALEAVRFARERANQLEVAEDRHPGRDLLRFVFGDLAG